jgi:FKBP-type peptidyl-prolyl cis-trans isomerase (trigger factor)
MLSLQNEYDQQSRLRIKRALLDALAERASFAVPDSLLDGEFSTIWQRVEADMKAGKLDGDDVGKDEDTLRADYRDSFEKKHGVRLGFMSFFVKACVEAGAEISVGADLYILDTDATAAPTPRATANAPTRPTYRA